MLCCVGAVENDEAKCGDVSTHAPVLTRAVWQCGGGYQELTDRVQLLHFDLTQPLTDVQGSATMRSAHCFDSFMSE